MESGHGTSRITSLGRRDLLLGASASGILTLLRPASAAVLAASPAPIFGTYPGYGSRLADGTRGYLHTERMLRKPTGAVLAFGDHSAWYGWGNGTGSIAGTMESSAAYNLRQIAGSGKKLIWSQPLAMGYNAYSVFGYGDGHAKSGLQDVAKGTFDNSFRFIALELVKNGFADAVVRLGWEFNLAAFPWGIPWGVDPKVHASAYIAAFRHAVSTMRSVPGAVFKFLWCPNKGKPDQASSNLALAYPGDDVVDYVGMDVYDDELDWVNPQGFGTHVGKTRAQRWQECCLGGPSDFRLAWLSAFATDPGKRPAAAGVRPSGQKKIIIGEWGAGGPASIQDPKNDTFARARAYAGGDDGYYVAAMLAWIKANNVAMHGFYDIFDTGLGYTGAASFSSAVTQMPATPIVSVTANPLSTGTKTYIVPTLLPFQVGMPLILADQGAPTTRFLEATVRAYSSNALTVDVFAVKGSGTPASVRIGTHPNAEMPLSLAAFQAMV